MEKKMDTITGNVFLPKAENKKKKNINIQGININSYATHIVNNN